MTLWNWRIVEGKSHRDKPRWAIRRMSWTGWKYLDLKHPEFEWYRTDGVFHTECLTEDMDLIHVRYEQLMTQPQSLSWDRFRKRLFLWRLKNT